MGTRTTRRAVPESLTRRPRWAAGSRNKAGSPWDDASRPAASRRRRSGSAFFSQQQQAIKGVAIGGRQRRIILNPFNSPKSIPKFPKGDSGRHCSREATRTAIGSAAAPGTYFTKTPSTATSTDRCRRYEVFPAPRPRKPRPGADIRKASGYIATAVRRRGPPQAPRTRRNLGVRTSAHAGPWPLRAREAFRPPSACGIMRSSRSAGQSRNRTAMRRITSNSSSATCRSSANFAKASSPMPQARK